MALQSLSSEAGGGGETVGAVCNLFGGSNGVKVVGETEDRSRNSGLGEKVERSAAASALLILGSGREVYYSAV